MEQWIIEIDESDIRKAFIKIAHDYLKENDLVNSVILKEVHGDSNKNEEETTENQSEIDSTFNLYSGKNAESSSIFGGKFYDMQPSFEGVIFIGSGIISLLTALLPAFINKFGRRKIRIHRTKKSELIDLTGLSGEEASSIIRELRSSNSDE